MSKYDTNTTRICDDKEPNKLSYSIASLLRSVVARSASPRSPAGETVETLDHPGDKTDSTENNEESDVESDISVDSNHDAGEDDRLVGKDDEEDDDKAGGDPRLRLLPPHLLPPGLHLPHPLHGLLPPGWPPMGLLHHHSSLGAQNHNRTESGH